MKRYLDRSLHDLGLSFKTVAALENDDEQPDANSIVRHVYTIRQLLALTEQELLAIPNFGERTLREIYIQLGAIGFVKPGYEKLGSERAAIVNQQEAALQRLKRRLGYFADFT